MGLTIVEEKAIEDQFVRHESLIMELRAEVVILKAKIAVLEGK